MDLTVIYLFLLYAVCVTVFIEKNKIIHRVSETATLNSDTRAEWPASRYRDDLCNAFQLKAN
jgi:hypothetical protein